MANHKSNIFLEAWEKSGVALEVRVAKLLREMGWNVEVNQFYLDPYTETPREIDLIAERSHVISKSRNHFGGVTEEKIQMRLFIECKYIKDIILLFTKDRDEEKTMKAFMSMMPFAKLNDGNAVSTHPTGSANHRYFKQSTVVHQSDDNGERGFGIKGAQQLFHGISSKSFMNNVHYKIDYGIILARDFSRIGVSYLGGEPVELKNPTFFIMDYVDNTGTPTYSIADVISEDGLQTFMLERVTEFEQLKSDLTTMLANEERWKRIEETRNEQDQGSDNLFDIY